MIAVAVFLFCDQGVIFSMDFNRERKILCSVSDDRSLRLWQMVLPPGVDTSEQLDWESAKFEPLLELYGHAARVWDCKLLDDHIVSVGEVRAKIIILVGLY